MIRPHRVAVLLVGVLLLAACDATEEPEAQGETPTPTSEETVTLTVYLRTGGSAESRLAPVSREVPTEGSLALRAVELLLEGPRTGEDLERPWPEGTEVLAVAVDRGVATVDLSSDAFADAPESDAVAHLEVLALGALANTLTELPTIDEVRLTVEGESVAASEALTAFWGGWGVPRSLARDETLIGEEGRGRVPQLADFSRDPQTVGSADAAPVHVRSVRVRDRITYVRLVVEIADAQDHDRSADDFPRAYARSQPDQTVLEVTGIDSSDLAAMEAQMSEQLRAHIRGVEVGDGQRPKSVRVTVSPHESGRRDVYLHTSGSPSRIMLDIKK